MECNGKRYEIREKRKLKHQSGGKKPLIVGSELALCRNKKDVIKTGFKNKSEVFQYIVEEIEGVKEYNMEVQER